VAAGIFPDVLQVFLFDEAVVVFLVGRVLVKVMW
jgi:hypothetical protein